MSEDTDETGFLMDLLAAAMMDAVTEHHITQLKARVMVGNEAREVRLVIMPEEMSVEFRRPGKEN